MSDGLTPREQTMLEHGRRAHAWLDPEAPGLLELWRPLVASTDVDGARADDVLLVCAALVGVPAAVAEVRRRIAAACRRLEGVDVDDLVQRCWLRLFSTQQRILRYAGRGDLDGLFRVTTTRLALNAVRDARTDESLEHAVATEDLRPPPEDQLATAEYQRAFKASLEHAVAHLCDDDRLLLRLHLVDHLGIDALSSLLGVHRATAARRLERARSRVAVQVHQTLRDTLGEKGVEDSDLRRLRSQLDLSLSRILGPQRASQ